MKNDSFNLEAYFKRVNYEGGTDLSAETLRGLHIAHTLHVPFENLDVYLKKPIPLDRESLYQKIVKNLRGGYCFEMNGLFSFVLKEMGFQVTDLLARPTRDGVNFVGKTHQVLLVEVDGKRYLADVGYGNEGISTPVLLQEGLEQEQFAYTYRIISDDHKGWYILQKKVGDHYQPMYAFTLEACSPDDYLISNHFTATYPESFFTFVKFCTIPTREGRTTLFGMDLKVLANGALTERTLTSDEEYKKVLQDYFALDWDAISTL